MTSCILVRYHEIALKGRNRPAFVKKLADNLRLATRRLGVKEVRPIMGRIMLPLHSEEDWTEVKARVARTFGVVNFSLAWETPLDMGTIKEELKRRIGGCAFSSFRVRASRAYKEFPLTSMDIERELGAFVKELTGARVDLRGAEFTLFLEILPRQAFFYFSKEPGPGGLPVGISGKVTCLISGGIDSPVAAYRMMQRGCRVIFVHFHSYPFLDKSSQEKVKEICKILNQHQDRSRLYLIPLGEAQRRVSLSVRGPYRVVIYRRLMVRIASQIAIREGAKALVTGESLGQVASQTLENLSVIEEAVPLPIFRPLIGMDKEEISRGAQGIGTYSTSIIPDQDCCQLFLPSRVATYCTVEEIREAEKALDLDSLLSLAIDNLETVEI